MHDSFVCGLVVNFPNTLGDCRVQVRLEGISIALAIHSLDHLPTVLNGSPTSLGSFNFLEGKS